MECHCDTFDYDEGACVGAGCEWAAEFDDCLFRPKRPSEQPTPAPKEQPTSEPSEEPTSKPNEEPTAELYNHTATIMI